MNGKYYLLALSAIAGIICSNQGMTGFLIFFIIILSLICLNQKKNKKLILCAFILTFFFFFLTSEYTLKRNISNLNQSETTFVGKISSIPVIDGDRISFLFQLSDSETLQTLYYVKNEREKLDLKKITYGMTCYVEGELRPPSQATNFYAFDYQQYLSQQGIHWILTPRTLSSRKCLTIDVTLFDQLQKFRQQGLQKIEENYPESIIGIVSALAYGERRDIDSELLSAYQSLGIIHLLAVSGLHVGLIVTSLFFLLIRVGITRERTIEILIILLPIYMIVAGAAPSVIRAASMTIVVLLALRFRKALHPLDGISFVCLLLLFINPYYLFQLGFQLSFIVSFALIVSASTVWLKYTNYFSRLMAITMISQLVSFPIILYHFYEISLWSLPLNLFFIPFVSIFILPACLLSLLLVSVLEPLAHIFIIGLERLLHIAHSLLLYIDGMAVGHLLFGKPSILILCIFYCTIFYGFICWERGNGRRRYIKPLVLFVLVCFIQWYSPYLSASGEVTVLDVGQGDSIFIELPYRKAVYLIDTGGLVGFGKEERWQKRKKEFEVGRDIVLPYLKAKGIRKLDRIILTHGHYDHIGGTSAVIGNVKIDEILYSYRSDFNDFEKELLAFARKEGVQVRFIWEGEQWEVSDSQFYAVAPTGKEMTINDSSIVLFAKIGGLTWLFTGDLEEQGERRLISAYPALSVDVLKVGHHGSRTSSTVEFIDHITPKMAIISVGRNNRFGHPHGEVIDYFNEQNIKVMRTDQDGAIRFQFKGNKRSIERAVKH
ncbi:DNA internalization-related competence protein ComEC/Rec2 [Anaerobacillus sp. MEB173]|uniref:DNA internalization-related competence protein ComEC/Rec2 n=1 Tax=Anaerobacillus sp. MEB173 TaxID=3383345 RepID=UPI003F8E22B0